MPIYTEAHAERLKPDAGQSWRPSNGFEGELFCERVCAHCVRCPEDEPGCEISLFAFFASKGDPDYPKEWQIGSDGQPCCTAFERLEPSEAQQGLTPIPEGYKES